MKKNSVSFLMFSAFMLVLTGMPFQFLHIDLVKSAYAMPQPYTVPEPTTLSLLAACGVGIGIFSFIRRRNRK